MNVSSSSSSLLVGEFLGPGSLLGESGGGLAMLDAVAMAQTSEAVNVVVQRDLYNRLTLGLIMFSLSVVGVIGNLAVITVVFIDPALAIKNQISNATVVNLAFTDVLTCAVVGIPAGIYILFDLRSMNWYICRFQCSINLGMMEVSLYTMLVITLDRYIAVSRPLHYPQIMTQRRLVMMCMTTWLFYFNGGFASASMMWGRWVEFDYGGGHCDLDFLGKAEIFWWTVYNYSLCALPVLPILFLNIQIIRKSTGKSQAKGGQADKEQAATNAKLLKSMMIIVAAFFVLTVPITAVRQYKNAFSYMGRDASDFPQLLSTIFTMMQMLASVINPLIYGLFRKDFRDAFVKLFKQLSCRG